MSAQNILDKPLENLEGIRNQLLLLVQNSPTLANRSENQRGILNQNAVMTRTIDLYVGSFYQTLGDTLVDITEGNYPGINILVVSAFYGLVQLNEGLREYDLQMGDQLVNGTKIYQFWQRQALWHILQHYIFENNISYIWSLLSDSSPLFPYQRVFTHYWKLLKKQRTIKCFHLKVFKDNGQSAGSGSGKKRAEWLRKILHTNQDYLMGHPMPPEQIANIQRFVFKYVRC